MTSVQILVWPVGFLSSVFVDPGNHARLARDDRGVEPALGHRHGRESGSSTTPG
ncbi:hypothetical protein [Streptosporangium vulgare]|uniref:hypothetical protein n=1 Tax=Streptosporangium vulgare TaxID=46190 RepID=UPI0031D16295